MNIRQSNIAVVGIGAMGLALSAALLKTRPDTILVGRRKEQAEAVLKNGIVVSGKMTYRTRCKNFLTSIGELEAFRPGVIFLATKTFHLPQVLDDLRNVVQPGTRIISAHNGLGTEELIAERYGAGSAFRMTLNYGAELKSDKEGSITFFNPPNHLGALSSINRETGSQLASLLTAGGLDTEYVDDIKFYVWKKMVLKCSMAPLCAMTDKTIRELLEYPPTREIADASFREAFSVARAMGYDLGEDYIAQSTDYLAKVGIHKDSICTDIANKSETEIDFLGGKVVEYAKQKGIPVPHYVTMTNLVKAIESSY